jgi:hypothetical protein
MSKLTGRSKKDIFFPSTGLEKDRNNEPVKNLTGENTSEIKKDESGKDYSLIRETTENFIKGDTIKPGSLPRVDNFIQGGDYKVSETPESKTRSTDEPRTFSPVRLENKYSSMKSMGQAVAKWTSPDSSLLQKGEVNVGAMSELTSSIDKQREEAKAKAASDAAAKTAKQDKATAGVNQFGKMLQLFATGDAGETATERKKKAKSEEEKREKTKSAGPTFEEQIEEKQKTTTETDSGKDKNVTSL